MRNLILLALSALSVPAIAGSPFIWGSNNGEAAAVSLPDKICFQSGECLAPGTVPVSSVGASAPVQSSGGSSPVISMPAATAGNDGYITSSDWSTFNAKAGLNQVWSLSGNAGAGGSILGTTDAVDLIIQTNGFNQMVMSQSGGWESNQAFGVTEGTNKTQYRLSSAIEPTVSTATSNRKGFDVNLQYDAANGGYDFGGSLQAHTSRLYLGGTGEVNYGSVIEGNYLLDTAGKLNQFRTLNLEGYIAPGYEVTSFTGVQNNLATDSNTLTGVTMASNSVALTDVTAGQVQGVVAQVNLHGASTSSQGINVIAASSQIQGTSVVDTNVNAVSTYLTLEDSARAGGLTGVISNITVSGTASTGGITGMPIGVDVRGSANGGNIQSLNINTQVRENSVAGGVLGLNLSSNITDNAVLGSYTGSNANSSISGNATIDNVTMGTIGGQVSGAAVIQNMTGFMSNVSIAGTASTANLSGAQFFTSTQDTATSANGVKGVEISVTTATPQSQVTGLSIDTSGASILPAALDAGAQIQALTVNGGSVSMNATYDPPAAVGFFQNQYIGGNTTVANGVPISAYGFGTNMAQSINFQDDWTPDFTGLRLGYVNVGFVGAITGATGKTMDSWTGALGGFGNPSGGAGVIDQAIMFRAAGGLPQGGSLSINNVYGFQAMPTLCAIATNCWALFDDSGGENYVSKLAIGTASKKAASGVALDVVGMAAFTEGARLATSGSQPTCDASARGLMWNIEGGAGVADILQICQKDAADAFVWVTK